MNQIVTNIHYYNRLILRKFKQKVSQLTSSTTLLYLKHEKTTRNKQTKPKTKQKPHLSMHNLCTLEYLKNT